MDFQLPTEEIQYKALKLIPGLENVKMFRPGYAIEYDYFPPTQLSYTLETKLIKNLFLLSKSMVLPVTKKQPVRA